MPWSSPSDEHVARTLQEKLDALHRVALRLQHDPAAADLVQETCLRAWRHRDQTRPGDLGPWLFSILRHAWVDRWRHDRRRPVLVGLPDGIEDEAAPDHPAPLAPRDAADRSQLEQHFDDEIVAALDELPEPERLTLLFHTFGDMSYHEISTALECPLGTVMSRLHRARKRLQARLADYARKRGIADQRGRSQPPREETGHAAT